MVITKQIVADRIAAYLHHGITLAQLVDWAENAIMNAEFDDQSFDEVRSVVARLGVADVRTFALSWEDCKNLLRTLGYDARIEVLPA